ncbi:hypothetical protein B0T22DRAFT_125444 [Podospora appendiculata]|uniref:GPI anchored protein n=1 Tax=Podospora appendiculata TaxID=314037 RepID=A0AAE0X7A9_9PEZI|nr:hypothetical protein B0T22DRAFT_125444 [Podospora appendiculata]
MIHTTTIAFLSALAATLISLTHAKPVTTTSVVNLYLPQVDQAIVGSVVSAGPSLTSYSVNCPRGTPFTACEVGSGIGVVVGPQTVIWHMSFGPTLAADVSCALKNGDATCTGDYIAKGSTSHAVDTFTRFSTFAVTVTLTAGLERLAHAASSAHPSTSAVTMTTTAAPRILATATSTAPTLSPTDSASSSSSSVSLNYASLVTLHFGDSTVPTAAAAAAAVAANPSTSTSSAGVPRVTQNALLVGIAALAGGAMMMI